MRGPPSSSPFADRVISLNKKVMTSKKKIEVTRREPKKEDEGSFEEIRHVVQEGNTLWDIALMYDLRVEDIRRWNNLRGNVIHPKDELLLRISKKRGDLERLDLHL